MDTVPFGKLDVVIDKAGTPWLVTVPPMVTPPPTISCAWTQAQRDNSPKSIAIFRKTLISSLHKFHGPITNGDT